MWTSETIDLGRMREEQRRVYEHVGRVVVACARIDNRLVELLASLGAEKPPSTFEPRAKALAKTLASWSDAERLLERLVEIGRYRNRLGHSAMVALITTEDGQVRHGGRRERTNLEFEELDLAELSVWETRAEVLDLVLLALRHHIRNVNDWTLRRLAIDFFKTSDAEVSASIDYLFPG